MAELKDLEELKALRTGLERIEATVLKPQLTEVKNIPLIFEWYNEIASDIKNFPQKTEIDFKRVFIYVVLMLYSPRFFAGDTMIPGVRESIAKMLKISYPHTSNIAKDIVFHYRIYFLFHEQADTMLSRISERIEKQTIDLIQKGLRRK